MHDSLLMQNISASLNGICKDNGIKKITTIEIAVGYGSPINEKNLIDHLVDMNKGLVDHKTRAKVVFDNLPDQIAEIKIIEGAK
ncbi:MAG: hypothetical protein VB130_00460 [Clostridium sp.]|nr:hypothetical protein [Clostridium sp.]